MFFEGLVIFQSRGGAGIPNSDSESRNSEGLSSVPIPVPKSGRIPKNSEKAKGGPFASSNKNLDYFLKRIPFLLKFFLLFIVFCLFNSFFSIISANKNIIQLF